MIEWLAMPASGAAPMTLDTWAEAFSALGQTPRIVHEGPGVAWIEVATKRLRGYAVIEGGRVEAINFELPEPDAPSALALLEAVVAKLEWELHQEDDDEDDSP